MLHRFHRTGVRLAAGAAVALLLLSTSHAGQPSGAQAQASTPTTAPATTTSAATPAASPTPQRAPSGGLGYNYSAFHDTTNACSVWSPLFLHNWNGWSTTLTVTNYNLGGMTVDLRLVPLGGGPAILRSIKVPSTSGILVKPADLDLGESFAGSLDATACPNIMSTIVTHDRAGSDSMTVVAQNRPESQLFIPAVQNDAPAATSRVVVYNIDAERRAPVTVTYRVRGGEEVEQRLTIPGGTPILLDLSEAPKGLLGVQIESELGAQLIAAVYREGSDGSASATEAVLLGSRMAHLPLLYRNVGTGTTYNTAVRVMNVREGRLSPRITFYDRDAGTRIGPIQTDVTLGEGEYADIPISQFSQLRDGKIYAAVVEPGRDSTFSDALAVWAHTTSPRGLEFGYNGASQGDTHLIAPLVFRRLQGYDSAVQLQNLTGQTGTIIITFRDPRGRDVGGWTGRVAAHNSVTVYLPEVRNLADGFVGAADIATSVPMAAIVSTTQFSTPTAPATPE